MEKTHTFSTRKLLLIVSCFLAFYTPALTQAPSWQMDSTVTVSPEGDTVVTYQIRKTDFGRDIICCYPDQRSLTEKEKAELHKQSREEQKSENLRKLNAIRERRRRQPIRSGTYAVGEIPLISGVTPSGGKTYQIPIPTAPGIRFAPSVSLVYNSQAGDGAAGYGWDISGIPSIRLINQNVYYHGKAKAADISNNIDPVFALDGVPIVQNDDPATSQSYPYATARGHILVSRQVNGQGFIKSFTVLYPDGNKGVFESVLDNPDCNLPVFPIVRLENLQQDSITFHYLSGAALSFETALSTIKYGYDASGYPAATLRFGYSVSSDYARHYYAGKALSRSYYLSSFESWYGTSSLGHYELTHEVRDNVRLLTQVDCSCGGEQLPPLIFSYPAQSLPPATLDTLRVDTTKFLSTSYASDVAIFTKRGKLQKGRFDDGIVSYPVLSTYDAIKKSWGKRLYGSPYPQDQPILVAALLRDISIVDNSILSGTGFQTVECVDVDGDGTDEIVRVNFGSSTSTRSPLVLSVYKVDLSGHPSLQYNFTVQLQGVITEGSFHSPYRRQYFWGDYDGDGKVDLLTIAHNKNSHDKSQTCYAALIDIDGRQLLSEDVLFTFTETEDLAGEVFASDYDCDSRTELCRLTSSGLQVYRLGTSHHFSLDTSYSNIALYSSSLPHFTTDLNGDGYLDLVKPPYGSGSSWYVYAFNGKDFEVFPMTLTGYDANASYLFLDVNRDGLADLVKTSGSTVDVFLNEIGFRFSSARTSHGILSGTNGIASANVVDPSGMAAFIKLDGRYLKVYTWPHFSPVIRAVEASEDSHSRVRSCVYTYYPHQGRNPYGQVWYTDNTPVDNASGFAQRALPVTVLSREDAFEPSQSTFAYSSASYRYIDPIVHNLGLGFCGFSRIETTDDLTLPERITDTYCDGQRMGIITAERRRVGEYSSPCLATAYTYDDHSTPHGKLSPRLIRAVSTDALTGITTDVSYEPYDEYDFPTQVVTQKRVTPDTLATFEILTRTFAHSTSPSKYVLGAVTEESVIRERDGDPLFSWKERDSTAYDNLLRPVSRRHLVGRYNYYDAVVDSVAVDSVGFDPVGLRGRIRAVRQIRRAVLRDTPPDSAVFETLDADSLVVETRWTYDAHGNITSEKTAPYGAVVFTGDTLAYDALGRNLLSRTDALGRTTTYTGHDKYGHPASSTDHKGRTTSFTYDAWGRLVQTVRPDGMTEATALAWGGSGLYTVTRTATGSPESVTHYDALDREVRGGVKRFDGQWQYMDKEYDVRGRLYRISLPYRGTAPSLWNVYAYDDYDRPTSITEASGKVSTWAYSGTSTTTVRDGITSTSTTNAFGDVVRMADAGGTTFYTLCDDGQPCIISAPGDVATMFSYDGFGRRNEISDPSAGVRSEHWTWHPDGSSTVVRTNPNGTVTTHADRFGRTTLVERSGAHSTAYSYDNDGLLVSMISDNGADRIFTYDAQDRVATVTDTVSVMGGTRWVRETYTYGAGSVVASVKYTTPNGDITTETYTYANGHNIGITLPDNTPVWSLVSENDLGSPTQILSGSVTRQYGYSSTGLPTYRKMGSATNGGLGSLQHFTYQFNAQTGNLMSRVDVNHNQSESFTYDTLGRLVSINGRTVTYENPTGNITAIGGVGTMTYGDPYHPYRITGMTPVADSLVSFAPQTIQYASFDRPEMIREGADSVSFRYGCDGRRVSMDYISCFDESIMFYSRDYIGSRYECERQDSLLTREILYLGGDAYSAPMALVLDPMDDDWTLYNIGRDYLGSITQVATADGTLVAEYSYDPWGRLRDPETLSIYARGNEPDLFLGRGFTGHEHLKQFGLINMNARLYDPLAGRFLSPDPFIQDPGFSQNFNRYSYALNNPLKYTDEDGELFLTWSISGNRIKLGLNFGYWGFGVSFSFGATEDRSVGVYTEIGFHIGGDKFGVNTSAEFSYAYYLSNKDKKHSFSSTLNASVSLGVFKASASVSYSFNNNTGVDSGTLAAGLSASVTLLKHLSSSASYRYSYDADTNESRHKGSFALLYKTQLLDQDLFSGLSLDTEWKEGGDKPTMTISPYLLFSGSSHIKNKKIEKSYTEGLSELQQFSMKDLKQVENDQKMRIEPIAAHYGSFNSSSFAAYRKYEIRHLLFLLGLETKK